MHDDIFKVWRYRKHSMFSKNHALFSSNRHFVKIAGRDTYLKSVVVMNRIKFMLYFNYSFESQFTLVHVICQCCLYSTLRFQLIWAENSSELFWSPFVRRLSVCPSVCLSVNFSFFRLLLKSRKANFNQIGTMHPWVKGIQVCSNEGPFPFPKADNCKIAKIH